MLWVKVRTDCVFRELSHYMFHYGDVWEDKTIKTSERCTHNYSGAGKGVLICHAWNFSEGHSIIEHN